MTILWGHDLGFTRTQAEMYLVIIVPLVLMMLWRREPLESAGVSRQNLEGSVVIGIIIGLMIIGAKIASGSYIQDEDGIMAIPNTIWDLPGYVTIGFAEEFVFRGGIFKPGS